MIEYCYRLNLPRLENVILSDNQLKKLIPENHRGSRVLYLHPQEIFQPVWLTYKNLPWDYVSVFIRSGMAESFLHRDNPHNSRLLHWGINWIIGNDSVMEFWEEEEIEKENVIIDGGGKTTIILSTSLNPSKSYKMTSGAYLINASKPHRIKNLTNDIRIAVSLRSQKFISKNYFFSWEEVVDMFKDVIID